MALLETYHQSKQALGSTIGLTIVTERPRTQGERILKMLWRRVFEFERRCSRFIADSELTSLNKSAGIRFIASEELRTILTKAKEIGQHTEGLFNPFILPDLQRAGYVQSRVEAYASEPVPAYLDRSVAPLSSLEIGDTWVRIPYGSALDLGGCGKGYMGDVLADIVDGEAGIAGYWLSIGGDVIARGIHANGNTQSISIVSSDSDRAILARVPVPQKKRIAVATSTILKRKGVHRGKAWHHIIDPRTGHPADTDVQQASVIGLSLMESDIHASNLIIVGESEADSYRRSQGLQAAFVVYSLEGKRQGRWCGESFAL